MAPAGDRSANSPYPHSPPPSLCRGTLIAATGASRLPHCCLLARKGLCSRLPWLPLSKVKEPPCFPHHAPPQSWVQPECGQLFTDLLPLSLLLVIGLS